MNNSEHIDNYTKQRISRIRTSLEIMQERADSLTTALYKEYGETHPLFIKSVVDSIDRFTNSFWNAFKL